MSAAMPGTMKVPVPALLLLGAIVLTVAVYWIGLSGPFMFDDQPTFATLRQWLDGKAPLREVLFGNTSWATHRSLSMSSFALNAWLFGFKAYGFKLGNLVLHVACGFAGYKLLSALLRRDPILGARSSLAAALITTVWLLHPLNVSTVLYAVQRMAQWATLCCLLGLWLYVAMRSRIEERATNATWATLFIGIPLLTLLGIQGKQNAAILPALCLVVELAYFRMPRTWPRQLMGLHALFVFLPAVLAVLGLALRPDLLMQGYGEYTFSPFERLLSEGRVLCEYLRMLLAPFPPSMGVYTDDYVPSSGLLSPPSTALALAFLLVASVAAYRVRKTLPSVFGGWFLFLVGHAVEGTLLPLELYYEHRNYLPAFGLFLACAGLIAAAGRGLAKVQVRGSRIGVVSMIFLIAVLALQTHGRALVWSDANVLAESALRSHPNSARAVITNVGMAMEAGDHARAYAIASETLLSTNNPRLRAQVMLFRIHVDCAINGRASVEDLSRAAASLPRHVDLTTVQLFGYAAQKVEGTPPCAGITPIELADAMVLAVDRATLQSDNAWPKWVLRYKAASLYASAGHWDDALEQANLSWQPSTHPARAKLLVRAMLRKGDIAGAQRIYREAAVRTDLDSPGAVKGLQQLQQLIEQARVAAARAAKPIDDTPPPLPSTRP